MQRDPVAYASAIIDEVRPMLERDRSSPPRIQDVTVSGEFPDTEIVVVFRSGDEDLSVATPIWGLDNPPAEEWLPPTHLATVVHPLLSEDIALALLRRR